MPENVEQLHQKIEALEQEVAAIKRTTLRGVRKRSATTIGGLPLYDIALGPDPSKEEVRGHARGIIAIGDIATGVLAIGGVAYGLITLGGCAFGILLGVGGVATGVLALGGAAIGGFAIGCGAVGLAAIGGAAFGYYACGGEAAGKYVFDAMQRDPEAVKFFVNGCQILSDGFGRAGKLLQKLLVLADSLDGETEVTAWT